MTTNLPGIFQTVIALLSTKSREVVKSVLGFVKVGVGVLTLDELRSRLKNIVAALMQWAKDSKNRFKTKVRGILTKLVNRVGSEPMQAVMPAEHSSLLSHILKEKRKQKRKKRPKLGGSKNSDDSDFSDESDDQSQQPASRVSE